MSSDLMPPDGSWNAANVYSDHLMTADSQSLERQSKKQVRVVYFQNS